MTLKEYRTGKKRRMFAAFRNFGIVALIIGALLTLSAGMAGNQASAKEIPPPSAMHQQMQAEMQDMMVMMQNAAVWTSQGLVVLQGNRLLYYTPDLRLQHKLALPVYEAPALTAPGTTRNGLAPGGMAQAAMPSVRSMVAARILPAADGLLVIRGRQIIWLDNKFKVTAQATLPELPPLTPAELAAVCPINQSMMPGAGRFMGGSGVQGMPGMQLLGAPEQPTRHPVPPR